MEAIRQYIESLFMNLPNTKEVFKAKEHLMEMAEDKYSNLKDEGVSDNEAVAQVIAEFGNLDELKADLGIEEAMNWQAENRQGVNMINVDLVKNLIKDSATAALIRGIGAMCFICCVVPPMILQNSFSAVGLFVMVAIGVLCMVFQRTILEKWDYVKVTPCGIDYATAEYVKSERNRNRMFHVTLRAIGVLCIVLCWLPATGLHGIWGGAMLFILVGIGVVFAVYANSVENTYNRLLGLNPMTTYGSTYAKGSNRVVYSNPNVAAVMSIYWPLVTCLYFSISFLTFAWHITWIIFPISGLVHRYIEEAVGERE